MGVIIGLLCIGIPFLAIRSMIISSAAGLVGVRGPGFFEGMGVAFAQTLAELFAGIGVGMAVVMLAGSGEALNVNLSPEAQQLLSIGFGIGLFLLGPIISALVFSVMLQDCSFGRGLLVWVAQFVVIAIFFVMIYVIVLIFSPATMSKLRPG